MPGPPRPAGSVSRGSADSFAHFAAVGEHVALTLGLVWTVRMVPAPNLSGEYLGLRLMDDDGILLRP
jgi:hypothetical protein